MGNKTAGEVLIRHKSWAPYPGKKFQSNILQVFILPHLSVFLHAQKGKATRDKKDVLFSLLMFAFFYIK
jgi:hypothetical protein